MDSDDESFDNVDSGNVSSGDDDFAMDVDINNAKDRQTEPDDYPYEVLTTEEIVQHMIDCIKDVNTVVEVGSVSLSYRTQRKILISIPSQN
jgi:ariadne-1